MAECYSLFALRRPVRLGDVGLGSRMGSPLMATGLGSAAEKKLIAARRKREAFSCLVGPEIPGETRELLWSRQA